MSLTLDENHVYRLGDRIIDGLTSTIKEAGLIREGDPWFMGRGTAAHAATEYYDKGTLESDSVDPQIAGYLRSWQLYRLEQDYQPAEIEYPTHHPVLLVGMKIDRLPGPIDLKTGGPAPWHILQVAVHWDALRAHGLHEYAESPADIYLDEEGKSPKVVTYTPREMREAFKLYCSMLHFIRWKREKGYRNAA